MKRTTHLFSLVVAICSIFAPSGVHSEQYGAFTYSSDGTAITIQRYHCRDGNGIAVIPDRINGMPVSKIGSKAFQNCDALISITIPDSVTRIGNMAFYSCDALTNVTIGSSVSSIGGRAFSHCGNLTRVTLPGSVSNLSGTAFIDCDNLSRVYVAGNELTFDVSVFLSSRPTIYYLTGTLGWDESYWDRRIALWSLPGWSDSSASNSTGRPPIANLAGTTHAEGVMGAYARWVHPVWYDVGTASRVGEADPHTGTARQCKDNLRKIYRAIDQYAMEHAKLAGDEIEAEEFAGFGLYISGGARRLICPDGGDYSPIIVNQVPRCSLEAHALR